MLRFSHSDSGGSERWSLCGRLAGPWVDELRSFWLRARERAPRAKPLVDLRDVTFIDESGEKLLADMQCAGAKFLAAGVEHKHLIANLNCEGKRSLRRRAEHLNGGCK